MRQQKVLILVLEEDGLRDIIITILGSILMIVLILVLEEDGLRVKKENLDAIKALAVLILVLEEDGLRGINKKFNTMENTSLNPCFRGRWSASPSEARRDGNL